MNVTGIERKGLISNDGSLGWLMVDPAWVGSYCHIYIYTELGFAPELDELHIKTVLSSSLLSSTHVIFVYLAQRPDAPIYQSKSSRYPSFTCFYSLFV